MGWISNNCEVQSFNPGDYPIRLNTDCMACNARHVIWLQRKNVEKLIAELQWVLDREESVPAVQPADEPEYITRVPLHFDNGFIRLEGEVLVPLSKQFITEAGLRWIEQLCREEGCKIKCSNFS